MTVFDERYRFMKKEGDALIENKIYILYIMTNGVSGACTKVFLQT